MLEMTYTTEDTRAPLAKLIDGATIGLRHRRVMTISFVGVFLGAVMGTFLLPGRYQATSKILVKHERMDPPISADSSGSTPQFSEAVTDTEVNSEVELIRSPDLLAKVATASGLQNKPQSIWTNFWRRDNDPQKVLAATVRKLRSDLRVEALPKTNMISITYDSASPQQSAQVLNTLVDLYMEKHLAVHQAAGTYDFFHEQAQRYEHGLSEAESRLVKFRKAEGVVAPGQEKTATLQKVTEFRAELKQTQAAIAETEHRRQVLEAQAGTVPSRTTTEARLSDNPQLMGQLKFTLLNLELKRTELLQKFEPTYRLVTEVDTQLEQTRAAIEAAEKSQLREETTNRNPTYEWVDAELAKTRSELAAQQARAEVLKRTVASYEQQASVLDRQESVEQDLQRKKKAEEDNYLLYQRKQEEARISNALDRSRILNVAVAEPAVLPDLPSRSRLFSLLVGLLAAIAASVVSATTAEYLNPSLKTPVDVIEFLDVPVLASISLRAR
jgi:uncharacterized protein involved in exopolysaccharide biosynthesis